MKPDQQPTYNTNTPALAMRLAGCHRSPSSQVIVITRPAAAHAAHHPGCCPARPRQPAHQQPPCNVCVCVSVRQHADKTGATACARDTHTHTQAETTAVSMWTHCVLTKAASTFGHCRRQDVGVAIGFAHTQSGLRTCRLHRRAAASALAWAVRHPGRTPGGPSSARGGG